MIEHSTNTIGSGGAINPDQRRVERRQGRIGTSITGIVLIGLGVLFLLQNMGNLALMHNWWALFILIPAIGAFAKAWDEYRKADSRLTRTASSEILSGLVLSLIAAAFLFELNWGLAGPALIILIGLGILLNTALSRER